MTPAVENTAPSDSGHLFIRACLRKPVARTPVWMMRQAGRYLPQYREVRKHHDFTRMYKTPRVAAEVTLQPVDILGVDAAILFSDILVIPEAMGMKLMFVEGKGPLFPDPVRSASDLFRLKPIRPERDLEFVLEAIQLVRKKLENRVPLIGFSGAPWTLATYMVEGSGSKNFRYIKEWRYARPEELHRLLKSIAGAVTAYCRSQIEAGAQAIQLFDTWAGILDEAGFREFALPYVQRIIREVRVPGVPIIYFAKGAAVWLEQLAESGADVAGLDWTIPLGRARQALGNRMALQGNLDPTALYAPPAIIRKLVVNMLKDYGNGSGHVANLGHGILPDVPVAHAREFIRAVHEESGRFHE